MSQGDVRYLSLGREVLNLLANMGDAAKEAALKLGTLLLEGSNSSSGDSAKLEEIKDLLVSTLAKVEVISSRVESLEAVNREENINKDTIEGLFRNSESLNASLAGQINNIERRVEGSENILVKKVKELEEKILSETVDLKKDVGNHLAGMKKFTETNSKTTEKKLDEELAGMKKFMEVNAKEMDKKLDAKLKLLENTANGLGGRLKGVKNEIVAAVAAVKKEVDVCGHAARGYKVKGHPLIEAGDLMKQIIAKDGCPKCFDYNPKKCAYGYKSGDHKGRRYCGSCSGDGNSCE